MAPLPSGLGPGGQVLLSPPFSLQNWEPRWER